MTLLKSRLGAPVRCRGTSGAAWAGGVVTGQWANQVSFLTSNNLLGPEVRLVFNAGFIVFEAVAEGGLIPFVLR